MTKTRFVLLLSLVALLRTGIVGVGQLYFYVAWESAKNFPSGVIYLSSSVLTNLITKLIIQLHLPRETWWAIGLIITASMLFGLWGQTKALAEWGRPTLIIICLSPAFVILMTNVGHYDFLAISGVLLMVSARKQLWILIGTMLAVTGNPEQSLVAAIALVILVWGLGYDRFKRTSQTYIGVAVIGFVS